MQKRLTVLVTLLFLAVVAVFCFRAPLTSSFWLDETITAWIAQSEIKTLVSRTFTFQGQSPLYFLAIHCVIKFCGSSELALRGLSLLCGIGVLYIFARLLTRMGTPFVGILVAVMIVATNEVVAPLILSARPYAFGLFFMLLSCWGIVKWSGQRRRLVSVGIWIAALIVAFYSHYFFLLVLPLQLLHVVLINRVSLWRERRIVIWALAFLLLGIFPGILHLLQLAGRGGELHYARDVDFKVLRQLLPTTALFALLASLIFSRFQQPGSLLKNMLNRHFVFGLIWFLFPPLCFWLLSLALGYSVFIPRYFCWCIFGLGLMVATLLRNDLSKTKGPSKKVDGSVIAALVCMVLFLVRETGREWRIEDWRGAAQFVRQHVPPTVPVILYSGLVELRSPELVIDRANWDYLNAPFSVYGLMQPVLPLALDISRRENQTLRHSILTPFLGAADKFALVSLTQRRRDKLGREYLVGDNFAEFFTSEGFKRESHLDFDRVAVEIFGR